MTFLLSVGQIILISCKFYWMIDIIPTLIKTNKIKLLRGSRVNHHCLAPSFDFDDHRVHAYR